MAKVVDARGSGGREQQQREQDAHCDRLASPRRHGKPAALAVLLTLAPASLAAQRFVLTPAAHVPCARRVTPDSRLTFEPGCTRDGYAVSVAVPEGTYRVTVTLGDPRRATRTTIKSESRRLQLLDVATRPGEVVTRSFLVPVRTPALAPPPPNAPGGEAVRLTAGERDWYDWDDKLTLEVLGRDAGLKTLVVERATAPTIHLAGDSTMADQPFEPAASWGQMLSALLDGEVAVANHAHSGDTLKSFLTALRFDKLLAGVRAGDRVLIQFGHNDQKAEWPQTYADAATTYPAYLRAYVAEVRRRGARPVLVTPPQRLTYRDGRIVGSLDAYAAAVRRVGTEERVPVIDLNATTRTMYEAMGEPIAVRAFADGGRDRTHTIAYGAWLLANAVAAGLAAVDPDIAPHVTAGTFDPAHPPRPEEIAIPASLAPPRAEPLRARPDANRSPA